MRLVPSLSAAVLTTLAALAASPASAGGPFNGVLEMKITTDRAGGGTVKVSIGDVGVLNEMQMPGPQGQSISVKSLVLKDHPDTVYLINDAAKTYSEMPTHAGSPPVADDETWTVKKLGNETVNGFASVHATATSSKGTQIELWTTHDIMDPAEFSRAMGRESKMTNTMMKALEKEGASGFPAKMIAKQKDGGTTTMELTKVTRGGVTAATVALPAGYAKSTMGPAVGLPPDVQKQLDEKLKQLTPEQRAAMQKAMGGH